MSETAKETLQRVRNRRTAFAKKKAEAPPMRPAVLQSIRELNKYESRDAKAQIIETGSDYDYNAIVKAYMKKKDCSYLAATRAVERLVPKIFGIKDKWLEEINRDRESARAPVSIEKAEGRTWPEMVRYLKLEHKMTTLQAHTYIDRTWPGLRQGYIDQYNK